MKHEIKLVSSLQSHQEFCLTHCKGPSFISPDAISHQNSYAKWTACIQKVWSRKQIQMLYSIGQIELSIEKMYTCHFLPKNIWSSAWKRRKRGRLWDVKICFQNYRLESIGNNFPKHQNLDRPVHQKDSCTGDPITLSKGQLEIRTRGTSRNRTRNSYAKVYTDCQRTGWILSPLTSFMLSCMDGIWSGRGSSCYTIST